MESRHASAPCINSALGAAANHSFMEPHSSASKMTEREPAQPINRDDLAHSDRYDRKHLPMPTVKKQRLITINQELIECKAGNFRGLQQKGRK